MALRQYWFEKKRDAANTPIDVARVLQNRLAPVAGGHKRSADVIRNYQAMGGKLHSSYVCLLTATCSTSNVLMALYFCNYINMLPFKI